MSINFLLLVAFLYALLTAWIWAPILSYFVVSRKNSKKRRKRAALMSFVAGLIVAVIAFYVWIQLTTV